MPTKENEVWIYDTKKKDFLKIPVFGFLAADTSKDPALQAQQKHIRQWQDAQKSLRCFRNQPTVFVIGVGPFALPVLQQKNPDLCVLNPESEGGQLIRQYVTKNSHLSKLNKFVTSRELETGVVERLKDLDGKIAGMQFGYVLSYGEDKPVLDYYNKLKRQGLSPEELRGKFMEYYISTPIDKVPAEIRENVKLYRDVNQEKMEYLKKFLNKAKEEGLVQSSLVLPAEKAERPSVLAKYAVKAEKEPALKTTTKKAYGDR